MIAEITKTILEALKLAPRYLIAFAVFAGFLLFSRDELLKKIGVLDFTQNNRPWLGITLVAACSLFGVYVASVILNTIKRWWRSRNECNRIMKRLKLLTEDEKQILRYYLTKNTRANTLRIEDGVVQELVSERIIYRSASVGNAMEGFAHNIGDFVWNYIHVYPEILEGTTNTYRTDKVNW